MKKNNKILNFIKSFFILMGITTLVFLILNLVAPEKYTIKSLWMISTVLFISYLLGTLLFKSPISQRSLWIRRITVIGICCIIYPAILIIFDVVRCDSINLYIIYFVPYMIIFIIISVIAYFIADKIEKMYLKKINEKLKQNK